MRVNPDEFVELSNHGLMKLRSAVARAMVMLPSERSKATIVRLDEPSVLKFKAIKDLSQMFSGQAFSGTPSGSKSPTSPRSPRRKTQAASPRRRATPARPKPKATRRTKSQNRH
ncbi:hypothetical protein J6500_00690 [Bradyrhizobium sp. WSM 1704]|uniref:hypothetical protein n=1 Tax=Bradyrhizobium semiaridum TaxID=2821404 RepID=UPI001CE338D3|nr:hypothetical protein [Bradyrhizobium semiaridum]MCA6120423.1 hypothetical protein [Bradyrhizobium semiaridum]